MLKRKRCGLYDPAAAFIEVDRNNSTVSRGVIGGLPQLRVA